MTIDAVTKKGMPLTALSAAIVNRVNVLGETSKNATIATAIDIVTSLRARTRVAEMKSARHVILLSGYVPGWVKVGKHGRRCIRGGFGAGAPEYRFGMTPAARARDTREVAKLHVYEIGSNVPERRAKKHGTYLLVATNEDDARRYAREHNGARNFRGLARYALGEAAHRLSTRHSLDIAVHNSARAVAVKVVSAYWETHDLATAVDVVDGLRYATLALRGGKADVAAAQTAALAKVDGMIKHSVHQMGTSYFDTDAQVVAPKGFAT